MRLIYSTWPSPTALSEMGLSDQWSRPPGGDGVDLAVSSSVTPGAEPYLVHCDRHAGSLDLGRRRCSSADPAQRLAMPLLRRSGNGLGARRASTPGALAQRRIPGIWRVATEKRRVLARDAADWFFLVRDRKISRDSAPVRRFLTFASVYTGEPAGD